MLRPMYKPLTTGDLHHYTFHTSFNILLALSVETNAVPKALLQHVSSHLHLLLPHATHKAALQQWCMARPTKQYSSNHAVHLVLPTRQDPSNNDVHLVMPQTAQVATCPDNVHLTLLGGGGGGGGRKYFAYSSPTSTRTSFKSDSRRCRLRAVTSDGCHACQAVFKRDSGHSGTQTPSSSSTGDRHLDWGSFKPEDQTLIHQVTHPGPVRTPVRYLLLPCSLETVNGQSGILHHMYLQRLTHDTWTL